MLTTKHIDTGFPLTRLSVCYTSLEIYGDKVKFDWLKKIYSCKAVIIFNNPAPPSVGN